MNSSKEFGEERLYTNIFKGYENVLSMEALELETVQEFTVEFIETNSEYTQGISLAINVGRGYLEINGEKARMIDLWEIGEGYPETDGGEYKTINLWEEGEPKVVKCMCVSDRGLLNVINIFGDDQGGFYPDEEAGMLVEQQGNSYIYRCNDIGLDTRFDKLVFKITLL